MNDNWIEETESFKRSQDFPRQALITSFLGAHEADHHSTARFHECCEREGTVGGDEGPVGGVAQVVCHGVNVVGVHGEEGQEKDGEVRGEVKGEVEQL